MGTPTSAGSPAAKTQVGRSAVALVVGIGEHLHVKECHLDELPCAPNDARELVRVLTDPACTGFAPDRVTLLTNADARRETVIQHLSEWLPEQGQGAELVLIFFAGHGRLRRTAGGQEEGFLLPHDADTRNLAATGIAMRDVARWIDDIQAAGAAAVVLILDCCRAASIRKRNSLDGSSLSSQSGLNPAALALLAGKGRFIITACGEDQDSLEMEHLDHGLFTWHLLQALRGRAADADGGVTIDKLFLDVQHHVATEANRWGYKQEPWRSFEGGSIHLVLPRPRAASTVTGKAETVPDRTAGSGGGGRTKVPASPPTGTLDLTNEAAVLAALPRLIAGLGSANVAALFRFLLHQSPRVKAAAHKAIKANWPRVNSAVLDLAQKSAASKANEAYLTTVLKGLNAYRAHPRIVELLDHLVDDLPPSLRLFGIEMLEDKRLRLGVDQVARLFEELPSPYLIEKALGQGAATGAYLARHRRTRQEVVVRVLRPKFAEDYTVRSLFRRLCERSVVFRHHCLVRTHDVFADARRKLYGVVRDHVPTATLRQALQAGPLAPADALDVLRQTAEALAAVHREGAWHGGVKPGNIFWEARPTGGQAVLGDPSLLLADPALPAESFGVPPERLADEFRYAAPEVHEGQLGPAADLYALGCLAYELLCRRPPFTALLRSELVMQHRRTAPEPPSQHGSPLGRAGDDFVLRLLAKDPARRFPDAPAVLRALTELPLALETTTSLSSAGEPETGCTTAQRRQVYLTQESVVDYSAAASASQPAPPSREQQAEGEMPQAFGRYRIRRELGRGGMGSVYLALDPQLDREVALKVLHRWGMDSPQQQERFVREARVLARLDHPNICPIYDVGQQEGVLYLVMRYIEGDSLMDRLRAGGPMDQVDATRLVERIARALQFAHEQGIVHRDVKPANILLDQRLGEPIILDFGLAALREGGARLTGSGHFAGTPAYMSPEQITNFRQVKPAADQYSLGATLYHLLCGCGPFSPFEGSLHSLYHQILERSPPPMRQVRPDVDPSLEEICLRTLAKAPAERFPSMAAFADALAAWLRKRGEEGQAGVNAP